MKPALAAPASLSVSDRSVSDRSVPNRPVLNDPRLAEARFDEALRAWRRGSLDFRGRHKGHRGFEAAVEALYRGHLWRIRRAADLAASWFEREKPWVDRALAAGGIGLGADHIGPCLAEAYLRSYQALLPAVHRPGERAIEEDPRREKGDRANFARQPFAIEPTRRDEYDEDLECAAA